LKIGSMMSIKSLKLLYWFASCPPRFNPRRVLSTILRKGSLHILLHALHVLLTPKELCEELFCGIWWWRWWWWITGLIPSGTATCLSSVIHRTVSVRHLHISAIVIIRRCCNNYSRMKNYIVLNSLETINSYNKTEAQYVIPINTTSQIRLLERNTSHPLQPKLPAYVH
jgi:hypothetical protein